jgi:biopolymer transport protein ExbD
MSIALSYPRSEPLGEINTTPLIDVMLVLLVMLILALPATTNTLSYPLPKTGTGPAPDPVRNTIAITADDRTNWNGLPVSENELVRAIVSARRLSPEPELLVAPDPRASYDESAHVLWLIKAAGATNVGFVGNERYRQFGSGGPKDPTGHAR